MSPLPRNPAARTPPEAVKHEFCWAKTTPSGQPGISVAQHCRTAGIVASLLAQQTPAWLAHTVQIDTGESFQILSSQPEPVPDTRAQEQSETGRKSPSVN